MFRTTSGSNRSQTVISKPPRTFDHISFIQVGSNSSYFKLVRSAFKKLIARIYGDQKNALAKIKAGKDRLCEIMLNYDNPLGLVVYKKHLQNEYGFTKAFELKTLFLFNSSKNSGSGFGSRLFQRLDEVAKKMGASIIYCTASSKVEDSIKCALKNGYKINRTLEENEDTALYLLTKEL